ncbi:MAG: PorV/PorQ family protein [Ignavibacteria bacterium]|nr:PorV/PorQ family protein [Ignavibacteria bacterium]
MKNMIIKSLVLLFVCSYTMNLYAQSFSNVGSAGATFLKIPVEPVGAALGNSNVASVEGVTGMYWNPSALAYINGTDVVASHVSWLADTRLSFVGVAQNIGYGALGISFTALTMDQMEITTETQPDGTGQYFNAGSYCAGISYGMNVIDRFSFGGTVKYIYDYIWTTNGSTWAFDLGSVYRTDFHNLRIGMRLVNFGGNITYSGDAIDQKPSVIQQSGISYPYDPRNERVSPEYTLPQLFNVGIAIDPINTKENKLTLSAAVNDPNDNNTQLLFGGDYKWNETLSLRVGYKTGFDEQGLSTGLGLQTNLYGMMSHLDFSYVAFGRLGHVITLGIRIES